MGPKHSPHLKNVVADQDEEDALDQGEDRQRRHLREDVIRQSDIQIALALQHRPVANNVVGAVGQRQKHRSEEHTSELQSHLNLVCRLLLEKKKTKQKLTKQKPK